MFQETKLHLPIRFANRLPPVIVYECAGPHSSVAGELSKHTLLTNEQQCISVSLCVKDVNVIFKKQTIISCNALL
jgi:hypothetical protein